MFHTILAVVLVLSAFLISFAALLGIALINVKKEKSLRHIAKVDLQKVTFLFEDETLVDATSAAHQVLENTSISGSDWARLVSILKPRFAGIEDLAWSTVEAGFVSIVSSDQTSRLDAEITHGMLRLELTDDETSDAKAGLDRHSVMALQAELATLRETAQKVPFLNWRENPKGEIIWANRAYLDIAEIVHTGNGFATWPPAHLFENTTATDDLSTRRVSLMLPGEKGENWFDLHSAGLGKDTLLTAIPVDQVVRAEAALSEFVTTLTGTFAHLPIGLAIFDQNRKLSLFNPALTDLTMLPAEFLVGQPTLFAFLDRLRDKRMIPEPKDYKTWRQEMSELEEKAVNGSYLETWFLPTGQTYRVTGRPHPGGAVAFLIEDISSEISLAHRFRAELEMGRAALDALDEAVAIFTAGGVLSMANSAYEKLWGSNPSTSLDDISITDATFVWNKKCNPTPVWRQLRGFISEQSERRKWTAPVTLKDGRILTCRIMPMIEGATFVSFSQTRTEAPARELEPVSASIGT